jgi:hypothetical protein
MEKRTAASPRRPTKSEVARKRLKRLRAKARVGDVISPSGESWKAERGRL